MKLSFEDFLEKYKNIPHHAIVLASRDFFGKVSLDFQSFQKFLKDFSNISLTLAQDTDEAHWMESVKHPDVHVLSGYSSPIKIDNVTKVVSLCHTPPLLGNKRIFFIDHAENMTLSAANALLKTLEEPEISCLFLMTTAFPHLLLPTIKSRVMTLNLNLKKDTSHKKDSLSKDELKSLENIVNALKPNSIQTSITLKTKNEVKADFPIHDLNTILELSSSLTLKYRDTLISDTLISLLAKKLKEDKNLLSSVKFLLGFLWDWKNTQSLNPNHSLWLARILIAIKNSS